MAARTRGWRQVGAALLAPAAQGAIRPAGASGFFLAGYALFGLHALPFHLVIFATQIANLALAASIGTRLAGSRTAGLWAALLWAVNSVLVEPLGWICVYDQVLWGLCVLVAFHALLCYAKTGERRWAILEWVAFLAGFAALESNVAYPALAALYAWLLARHCLRRTLPMLAVSLAYTALHLAAAPLPRTGEYATHFTRPMLRTLLQYVTWSAGPTLWWTPYRAPAWLVAALAGTIVAGLVGFAAARNRRALFCLGWYVAALALALPLRDHMTEYYPFVPLLGLCWLGGWAVTECWWRGGRAKLAALALAALYAALVVPRTLAADAWNQRVSLRARDLVEGVAVARQRHPRQALLLDGVDPELFANAIADQPFRVLGDQQVYLARGGPEAQAFVLPAEVSAQALAHHEATVYDVRGGGLREMPAPFAAGVPASAAPARIDVASPLAAYLPGPEWYAAEGNHRWMPDRATVRMAGPRSAAEKLYLADCRGGLPGNLIGAGIALLGAAGLRRVVLHPREGPGGLEFAHHGLDEPSVELARIGVAANDDGLSRTALRVLVVADLAAPVVQMVGHIDRRQGLFEAIEARGKLGIARNAQTDLMQGLSANRLRNFLEGVQPRLLRVPTRGYGIGKSVLVEDPGSRAFEHSHSVDNRQNRLAVHHDLRRICLKLRHSLVCAPFDRWAAVPERRRLLILSAASRGNFRRASPVGAALAQLEIEVAQGGELAGERGRAGSLWLAARVEVAAAKQVGGGNYRGPHGAVLVSPLGPSQFAVQPKIETHLLQRGGRQFPQRPEKLFGLEGLA